MKTWTHEDAKFGDEYWDKCMIYKFLKDMKTKIGEGECYNFYVEY